MLFLKLFPEINERIIFEIILHALKLQTTSQFISQGTVISKIEEEQIMAHLLAIKNGKPYEYIVGKCNFMGNDFIVNDTVLIPRIDTETLVDFAFGLKKFNENLRILDICTGSGCIGVSLAKFFVNSSVFAVDISPKALEIAQINAKNNNVDERFSVLKMDILHEFPSIEFDLVIANPPYIPTSDVGNLEASVRNFEPHLALDGGADGLVFYRRLAKYASTMQHCHFIFEIGHDQSQAVQSILYDFGIKNTTVLQDFGKNDRGVHFCV